jgi:hypothetical protein
MEKKEVKEVVKSSDDLKLEAANLRKQELEKATKEIQEICKKYNCGLDADFAVSRSAIEPRVFIVDLKQ